VEYNWGRKTEYFLVFVTDERVKYTPSAAQRGLLLDVVRNRTRVHMYSVQYCIGDTMYVLWDKIRY